MKKWLLAIALLLSLDASAAAEFLQAKDACTDNEVWHYTKKFPKEWKTSFESYLSRGLPEVFGYSEAMSLQQESQTREEQILAIYWKNHSLYRSGLFHMASSGFNWLAAEPVKKETVGIQLAALECLNRIHYEYSRLYMARAVEKRLPSYSKVVRSSKIFSENKQVYWESLGILLRAQLSERRSPKEVNRVLGLLRGTGAHLQLAQGLNAVERKEVDQAIRFLKKFIENSKRPSSLDRYVDVARLSLARSYYKKKNFKMAQKVLKQVRKDSNEITSVLAELSWVHYMQGDYGSAVGSAMNLQTGSLRNTFAPEGLMVMAMSLNELCQYPSSLRSVRFLKNQYRNSYFWLKEWLKKDGNKKKRKKKNDQLYNQVTAFLDSGKSDIPLPVLSEWTRSPVFLSHQEELNLFIDERDFTKRFLYNQKNEFKKLKNEISELSVEVKKSVAAAKAELKKGEELPDQVKDAQALLRLKKYRYQRMKKAIVGFKKVARLFAKQTPILQDKIAKRINAELGFRNIGMLKRLKSTAENSYLIEVEIYNGASEDVVWQNAHPDYKEYARKIRDEVASANAEKVWNWGKLARSEDGAEEVWADELGTLKADITNNCGSKDRYLDVKFDQAILQGK